MEQDKVYTCRLFENETNYLNNHYDGKFSSFVHNSFKRDIEMKNNNNKKNILKAFSTHFLFVGLGAIFILFSLSVKGLASFLLAFLMGVFFVMTGLVNMFLELKDMGVIDEIYTKKH